MKVLVIGSGGREHAIAWKLAQSQQVSELYGAPGNPGMAAVAENIPLAVDDFDGLVNFSKDKGIDLVVVGPEYPLTLGVTDKLQAVGIAVFGPTQAAAKIEGSKAYAKEIMKAAGIPTAGYQKFRTAEDAATSVREQGAPLVVKVDGLAAGKGVFVCQTVEEALAGVDQAFTKFGAEEVIVEEMLEGVEASYIVVTDGKRVFPLAASHDYKRIADGDIGPNTGGMGTVSPTPRLSDEQEDWVLKNVMQPVVDELRERGTPFVGFLYAGLMISSDGAINVLEFNARLGDPETQVIMRRLKSDLFDLIYPLAVETDHEPQPTEWLEDTAVCVVMASAGYPESSRSGDIITGISEAEALASCVVFHAGTGLDPTGALTTAGGRVLGVTAIGETVEAARLKAYQCCEIISFDGCQYRGDIAG